MKSSTNKGTKTIFVVEGKWGESYRWVFGDAFETREKAKEFSNNYVRHWPGHRLRIVQFSRLSVLESVSAE
jgi:hypothetical protein